MTKQVYMCTCSCLGLYNEHMGNRLLIVESSQG